MTLSAHIQFIPIQEKSPMEAVDKAILIIQNSDVSYEVGPFGTSIEGSKVNVMKVIENLLESDISTEFLLNTQYHVGHARLSNAHKVAKFR